MVIALGLLVGNVAEAGNLTLGIGAGALLDVPDLGSSTKATTCSSLSTENAFRPYKVLEAPGDADGRPQNTERSCRGTVRGGGQLVVPVRVHLGPLAVLRITPGMQAIAYSGTISWDKAQEPKGIELGEEPLELTYTGHAAYLLRPQLAVGGEFAFSPKGITPYIGASVSAGLNVDIQSLGPNSKGQHGETTGAYASRTAAHCNQDGSSTENCDYDALNMGFGVGAEVALGVRTASPDQPGFFVEGAFNVLGLRARAPRNYNASVMLGAANLNNLGLTAGVLIPL